MADFKTFNNPPIREAIFDIQVSLPSEVTLKDLEEIFTLVEERFPSKEHKYTVEAELAAPDKKTIDSGVGQIPTKAGIVGVFFKSDIDKKIFQARLNGFTFNKLKPYKDWETFSEEAKELWNIYKKYAKPIKINRIAVRYINRIDIPLPFESFSDYLTSAPQLPEGIPQGLSGFFMQLLLPKPEINAMAAITQTIEQPSKENKLPFILDIDVFKEGNFDDKEDIFWNSFSELRNFKNEIFFNCLTNKAKELFE